MSERTGALSARALNHGSIEGMGRGEPIKERTGSEHGSINAGGRSGGRFRLDVDRRVAGGGASGARVFCQCLPSSAQRVGVRVITRPRARRKEAPAWSMPGRSGAEAGEGATSPSLCLPGRSATEGLGVLARSRPLWRFVPVPKRPPGRLLFGGGAVEAVSSLCLTARGPAARASRV